MKYCTSCGKELFDEAVMCPQCGASQMPKAPEAQPQTVAEEKAVKPESAVKIKKAPYYNNCSHRCTGSCSGGRFPCYQALRRL